MSLKIKIEIKTREFDDEERNVRFATRNDGIEAKQITFTVLECVESEQNKKVLDWIQYFTNKKEVSSGDSFSICPIGTKKEISESLYYYINLLDEAVLITPNIGDEVMVKYTWIELSEKEDTYHGMDSLEAFTYLGDCKKEFYSLTTAFFSKNGDYKVITDGESSRRHVLGIRDFPLVTHYDELTKVWNINKTYEDENINVRLHRHSGCLV